MPTLLTNAWRRSALVLLAGVLSACAGHQRLQPALHELDTGPLGVSPPTALDAPLEASAWWEAWGDARLSALIDQALADSPTVQVAQARLQRAQAQERFARGSDLPQVQAAAPVPGVLCEVSNALLEGFTHAEWETLMGFLRRMAANAEALRDAPLTTAQSPDGASGGASDGSLDGGST